jgi:hypothetical protein
MGLLNPVAPERGESPLGYFRRLAEENSLPGWRELAYLAGVSPSRTGLFGRPRAVAAELGMQEGSLDELAHVEAEQRPLHRFQRGGGDAVCPACFDKAPYLRSHWDHVYVTACPLHRCLLVDHCHCGARLSARRLVLSHCDCGRALADLTASPASASQIWLSHVLAMGRSPARRSPTFRQVDASALTQIIRTLCALYDPTKPAPRRNAAEPKNVAQAVEFLAPLETLLANWPAGFNGHLKTRMDLGKTTARTLNACLGLWYSRLKKYSTSCAERPFLDAVVTYAAEHFPGLVGLDGAGIAGIKGKKPLSVKEAAARLCVRRDFVVTAIRRGKISAQARKFGERRLMYMVSELEVDRLLSERRSWVSEGTAAATLGVPPAVLASFVTAGAIEVDRGWRDDIAKSGPVSQLSVEALGARLRGAVRPGSVSEKLISLSELTGKRVGDKRALIALFKAITDGTLRPVRRVVTAGLGDLQFAWNEVREIFGSVVLDSGLTLEELARTTGWKYESIAHWIREGLMGCEKTTRRGQETRVITPKHLLAFTRQYMPVADLAKLLGTSASAATKRLASIEIIGAQRVSEGVNRGGIVRLADLASLLRVSV